MAKAYQCDRCMQYYTENKEVTPRGMDTSTFMTGIVVVTSVNSKRGTYELCDDCARRLLDFLENRKELKGD